MPFAIHVDRSNTPRPPVTRGNPFGWPGIPGATVWPVTADSSNPQAISYLKRHGFRVEPSVKGTGSIEEGITFLKSYDIVVHPRCPHVIDEMSAYSYEIDKNTEEILPVLADKKNHTIDSLRYAVEGERRSTYDSSLSWVGEWPVAGSRG
jgi:phage terminase large subunit